MPRRKAARAHAPGLAIQSDFHFMNISKAEQRTLHALAPRANARKF